jgi:negative regulator of sigma-B (phosphoserine phosphatase)
MTNSGDQDLEWSVATRPLPGESENGDSHLVARTAGGWLLAVADGLGHGPEAAAASTIFIEVLNRHLDEQPVRLIQLGHEALKSTRGVAGTIMTIDTRKSLLRWIGVGNVEAVVRRSGDQTATTEYVTMRGGIIGYRLPELQESRLVLQRGDILALATDGIDGNFVAALTSAHSPELLAERILVQYAKPADDALVLIGRWQAARQGRE